MSLSHETVLELMSLADGELQGADKERVEKLVASSEEARRIVESMRRGEVGAWLAASMDERAGKAGADGIADAVMAAAGQASNGPLKTSKAGLAIEGGGVVSMAGRSRRSSRVPMVASAVVALAAAVALYVRAGGDRPTDHAPVASVGIPPVDFQAPSARIAESAPAGGVEVNEIDAPSRGVSVFEIPVGAAAVATSGPSSVVVWVDDDPGSK